VGIIENMAGTPKFKRIPYPHPSLRPQREKDGPSWVHVEQSHWLHEHGNHGPGPNGLLEKNLNCHTKLVLVLGPRLNILLVRHAGMQVLGSFYFLEL
jgi:hypothetical protein